MKTRIALAATIAAALSAAGPALAQGPATPLVAQSCAGCHGQSGEGEGAIPKIAGYDREAFVEVWEAFRANERPATIMNRIARGFTDDEVAEMADYFSSLR